MREKIKDLIKKIPFSTKIVVKKNQLSYYFQNYKKVKLYIEEEAKKSDENIVFMFICPKYRNLGDHAIVVAEKKLINDLTSNFKVVDIYLEDTYIAVKVISNLIKDGDIIAFNGGGYIGNEYLHAEKIVRYLLKKFRKQKCIFFPQTFFFHDNKEGKKQLEKTINSYSKHNNFYLVAREQKSYELMKKHLSDSKVLLAPDIVFYLDESQRTKFNGGDSIVTCFRDDVESVVNYHKRVEIINEIKNKYGEVIVTDTVCKNDVSREGREKELEKLFQVFKNSKMIVTDRIHGMIFAAITQTPCVVLGNYNHKVKETYKWIKHLNYIKFVNSVDDILEAMQSLENIVPNEYDNGFAVKKYRDIINAITDK